jgi:hypothetical protein
MIPNSGYRFSEKMMRKQKAAAWASRVNDFAHGSRALPINFSPIQKPFSVTL